VAELVSFLRFFGASGTGLPVDPTTFLSTVAATSATMVAIVGGLLVARFVTISSEQEGAQNLLNDANERLTIAQRRFGAAYDEIYEWDVRDFFDVPTIRSIGSGTTDIRDLRGPRLSRRLTDEQFTNIIGEISAEFRSARAALRGLVRPQSQRGYVSWEDFQQSATGLPGIIWDDVWAIVYDDLAHPPATTDTFPNPYMLIPSRPEYDVLHMQRRDALRGNLDRAQQRMEDIESEVERLKRTRDAIVRPKGLGVGLVVLSVFTVAGVIIPIWLLSRGPTQLTTHLGEVVFWLFLVGLLALLGYISLLALRLSGWPGKLTMGISDWRKVRKKRRK
jgi:hypothetical protein